MSILSELRGRTLWVVIGCFLVQLGVGYGYAGAALDAYQLEHFGWSRAEQAATRAAQPYLLALASPLVGFLAARFGARFVLASGGLVLGLTFIVGASAQTWAQLVGLWAVQGLSVTLLGDIAVGSVVSQWTRRSRALALGIAYTGANVGGALTASAVVAVADVSSWRTAMVVLGVGALAVVVPAALWLVRDRPRDDQPEAEAPSEPEASLPLRDILRTRTFWVLVFTHVSYWLFLLMVLSSFVLMLVDRGMSRADATAHLAAATLIGGFAKVGFGLLALRMSARSAMRLDYGLLTLAAGLLFFIDHAWAVSAFVLLFGVGYAARDIVTPLVIADCYGTAAVAQVYGLVMLTFLISNLGGILAGLSFDRTGSYEPAIMGIGCLIALSFLSIGWIRDEQGGASGGTP